jgi:hypothetical protein
MGYSPELRSKTSLESSLFIISGTFYSVLDPAEPPRLAISPSRGRILGRNWDKSLQNFPPCYTSTNGFYSLPLSPPLSKSGLKLVCIVNILYGSLKSENS